MKSEFFNEQSGTSHPALFVFGLFPSQSGCAAHPLGIAALEDKIVQRAVADVLNAIYEEDFLGFSYAPLKGTGRPGRHAHLGYGE